MNLLSHYLIRPVQYLYAWTSISWLHDFPSLPSFIRLYILSSTFIRLSICSFSLCIQLSCPLYIIVYLPIYPYLSIYICLLVYLFYPLIMWSPLPSCPQFYVYPSFHLYTLMHVYNYIYTPISSSKLFIHLFFNLIICPFDYFYNYLVHSCQCLSVWLSILSFCISAFL